MLIIGVSIWNYIITLNYGENITKENHVTAKVLWLLQCTHIQFDLSIRSVCDLE